ncbi:MAG TPA: hypothetical protein DCQ98_01475 [Planctomycetaceae bacterium]|nr:hypothetical protein [Planctomycetaceae bacterium]
MIRSWQQANRAVTIGRQGERCRQGNRRARATNDRDRASIPTAVAARIHGKGNRQVVNATGASLDGLTSRGESLDGVGGFLVRDDRRRGGAE